MRIEDVRKHARSHAGALATWNALVDGTWSPVEQVDRDGQRSYHAYENAPHVRNERALTEQENVVVELFTRGQSGKEIAYATGLSECQVWRALASAAQSLGFDSRADMMRGLGLLRGSAAREFPTGPLTSAEREVLSLLRAGLRNAQIAQQRAISVHTVANQVASILRKTGAKSRRALMASAEV